MVCMIPGQGLRMQIFPAACSPALISFPFSSQIAGKIPSAAGPALPGFMRSSAGFVVQRKPPVSVCQNVSTIGQCSPPIFLWYHIHASGLIGSPTVPSRRKDDKSYFDGWIFASASAALINERIAVGAV